jgi:hypothetical protein
MTKRTLLETIVVGLAIVIVIGFVGSNLVGAAIDATYSSDWYSASTENAQHRHVFVKSVAIAPSLLAMNDSVAWTVTDAWVEHPTKVVRRWLVMRREVQDSGYRLVINLAQVARDPKLWTHGRDGSFADGDFLVNGDRDVAQSGDAHIHTLYSQSSRPFPDTVRLSIERHF